MNKHAPHPDLIKLTAIEARWRGARDTKYVAGAGAEHLAAGLDVIVEFGDAATADERQFYLYAWPDIRFLLDFAARAISHANKPRARDPAKDERLMQHLRRRSPGDFAAECAMKCQSQSFRVFLQERHGLQPDPTDDDIKACLYRALSISSRKVLNSNPEAASRWKDMRRDFEAWSTMG